MVINYLNLLKIILVHNLLSMYFQRPIMLNMNIMQQLLDLICIYSFTPKHDNLKDFLYISFVQHLVTYCRRPENICFFHQEMHNRRKLQICNTVYTLLLPMIYVNNESTLFHSYTVDIKYQMINENSIVSLFTYSTL